MNDLMCNYCQYQYQGKAASEFQLHTCSDDDLHFINRVDEFETPLADIDIKEKKQYNHFNNRKVPL